MGHGNTGDTTLTETPNAKLRAARGHVFDGLYTAGDWWRECSLCGQIETARNTLGVCPNKR